MHVATLMQPARTSRTIVGPERDLMCSIVVHDPTSLEHDPVVHPPFTAIGHIIIDGMVPGGTPCSGPYEGGPSERDLISMLEYLEG